MRVFPGIGIGAAVYICFSTATFAQGTVTFGNASTTANLPPGDRNVVFGSYTTNTFPSIPPGANVTSNYAGLNLSSLRVQLYTGTASDIFTWTAVAGTLSTFKQSTSGTPGSWFGKTGTIIPGAPGATVSLAVVVWDTNLHPTDPFSPTARTGWWGRSPIFQYTIPSSGTPSPSEFLMLNFHGMVVDYGIPEPSGLALAGLGMTALVIRRRMNR